jgi:hypothetical protein
VRCGSFGRLVGPRQRPGNGWQGEEQGPEGKGHTLESCGVRQKGMSGRVEAVAGSSIPPRQFPHFYVNSTAGRRCSRTVQELF